MTPADISVVIPTLDEAATIAAAIESVRDAGQVIVVDGGSRDATCSIAETFAGVTVVTSAPGRGVQLASGAERCERPVWLFLHADCQLAPSALDEICKTFERAPTRGWGALRQRIDAAGFRFRLLEMGNAARVRFRGLPFGDQAMFVKADWYRRAGGFEPLPLMEDLRLSLRLRRRAWPLLVEGPVIVSDRRWRRVGVARQTVLNTLLQCGHALGISPARLARFYR